MVDTHNETSKNKARTIIKQLVRDHQADIIKKLSHKLGNTALAEDVFQEALFKALNHWQKKIPENPQGWLYRTAKNLAIDHFRKQKIHQDNTLQVSVHFDQLLDNDGHNDDFFLIPDQELKLIFTCCHPALSFENQVALTLQVICGLNTKQIASTFIIEQKTIEQRLVRSKKKIKLAGIPYQVPCANEINQRLNAVLKVVYLIFNQGYYSEHNPNLAHERLINQSLRLGKLIVEMMPDHAESLGLLSLMHFHKARLSARTGNQFIDLATQDRTLWDRNDTDMANHLFTQAIKLKAMGPFQIQAAISGVHSQAECFQSTDWKQITLLYEKLLGLQDNVIIRINYAVALSFAGQPSLALKSLNQFEAEQVVAQYLPFYVAKAHVHGALDQFQMAKTCYSQAIELSSNPTEKNFLKTKLATLEQKNLL